MAGNKLVQTMISMSKKSSEENTSLLFGEVTSISPLKIWVDNRFEIDEQFLILSALVKEVIIKVPNPEASSHTHIVPMHSTSVAGEYPHSHTVQAITTGASLESIKLWRGLIVGDKVRLLRVNNGQMFYVIEREDGIQ